MKRIKVLLCTILVFSLFINITPVKVEAASINKKDITLNIDSTYELKVSGAVVTKWSSTKPGVASVKDGIVKAKNVGTNQIVAKTAKGNFKCNVTVKQTDTTKYTGSSYYADEQIEPGYYVLYNTSDISNASYAVFEGKAFNIYSTISTNGFKYNAIVKIEKGQTLYMENCYAKEFKQAIVRTSGEGSFLVGTHIKAGTYIVEAIKGYDIAVCSIGDSWSSDNTASYGLGKDGSVEITVKNNQYLMLVGCKLKNIK